ncbi:MAG TPA: hypothetical protein VH394_10030 [Thermoanaerobaculia bacterium]|nr:hypothetical protein [Thermoanaerobaculia bacterium]
MADSQASLLDQVRSGGNRQLQVLAASGFLPIAPEDLIPIQVQFARSNDVELASKAAEALRQVDPRVAATYLERQAGEDVLSFFASQASHPRLLETILRRRDVPRRILVDLARRLPTDLQEVLVLRQDAIVEEPAILEALEQNPQLSNYVQRRIAEYREHLLPRERTARTLGQQAEYVDEIDEAAFAAEVQAVKKTVPVEGEIEEKTGLTEGQIRMLSVPARLKIARGAPRNLRTVLMRDTNPQVACAALLFNNLTDQEIEQTAASRSVVEEVLQAIAKRREWIGRYPVMKALIHNPRFPLPLALKYLPRLSVKDMRDLAKDRNVPDAVRSTALRLYRIKQQ